MSNEKDLYTMFAGSKATLAGEEINLRPFPFGEIINVAKAAGSILDYIQVLPNEIKENIMSADLQSLKNDPQIIMMIMGLFEHSFDNVLYLVSICTQKDVAWVKALDPADGLEATIRTFMVNKDFFTQRLIPMLLTLMPIPPKEIKENQDAKLDGEKSLPN